MPPEMPAYVPLAVHHLNGDATDNRPENLQIREIAENRQLPHVTEETWDEESIQWIRDAAAKDPDDRDTLSWTVELSLIEQQKKLAPKGTLETRIKVEMKGPHRYMNALLVDPEPLRENLRGIPLSSPADALEDRISEMAAERMERTNG